MLRSLAATVCLAIAAVVFTVATAEAASLVNIYGNLGTVNASTTSNTVGYLSLSQPNQFQAQGFSVGNQLGSSAWDIQQIQVGVGGSRPAVGLVVVDYLERVLFALVREWTLVVEVLRLTLIHLSEYTRQRRNSYAVSCYKQTTPSIISSQTLF